jgi:AcrR family transcriptional regulator
MMPGSAKTGVTKDQEASGSTRQRLLDVALELFATHGFAGTSMRMLARAAGLRESSIYNHFAGKDELYQSVMEGWGPAEFVERLRSAEYRALIDQPADFLRLCGTHLVERWMDPREHMFTAMIARETPGSAGQQRYHQALFRDEIDLLTDYFTHFAHAHHFIAPTPAETARMFTGGLVQIRRNHFALPAQMPSKAVVTSAVNRYIDNFIATTLRG